MDIARLVDAIEVAIGKTADVETIERVASAILRQQVTAHNGRQSGRSLSPSTRNVDFPPDVFGSLTVGISLLDCSSPLPATVRARAYDRIRRVASRFADAAEALFRDYGLPTPPLQLSISPVSIFGNCDSVSDFIELAIVLDKAAVDVGVDAINGYTLIADRDLSVGDRHFVDSIPSAMAVTTRLFSSLVTPPPGVSNNAEIIQRLARTIVHSIALSDDRLTRSMNRFSIVVSRFLTNPSRVNHFYPTGLNDLTVTAAPSIERVTSSVHAGGALDYASAPKSLFQSAATIAQVGNQIERRLASKLAYASGMPVVSASETNATPPVGRGFVRGPVFQAPAFHEVERTKISIPENPTTEIVAEMLLAFCAGVASCEDPATGVLTFAV